MRISEVFATIQGEGMLAGVPSLFLRVSGCNLRCEWCDTPYTSWQAEGENRTLAEALEWVDGFPHYRHVVLTGGEPMLFAESVEWTRALRKRGLHVTIETAGTVWQPVECDLMSISPKLANSTPWGRDPEWAVRHEATRIQWDVLEMLKHSFACQWKFVVSSQQDLGEVEAMVRQLQVDAGSVLLMPEGTDVARLGETSGWLVDECKRTGYRYCPRLHVLLWGNRRGV